MTDKDDDRVPFAVVRGPSGPPRWRNIHDVRIEVDKLSFTYVYPKKKRPQKKEKPKRPKVIEVKRDWYQFYFICCIVVLFICFVWGVVQSFKSDFIESTKDYNSDGIDYEKYN